MDRRTRAATVHPHGVELRGPREERRAATSAAATQPRCAPGRGVGRESLYWVDAPPTWSRARGRMQRPPAPGRAAPSPEERGRCTPSPRRHRMRPRTRRGFPVEDTIAPWKPRPPGDVDGDGDVTILEGPRGVRRLVLEVEARGDPFAGPTTRERTSGVPPFPRRPGRQGATRQERRVTPEPPPVESRQPRRLGPPPTVPPPARSPLPAEGAPRTSDRRAARRRTLSAPLNASSNSRATPVLLAPASRPAWPGDPRGVAARRSRSAARYSRSEPAIMPSTSCLWSDMNSTTRRHREEDPRGEEPAVVGGSPCALHHVEQAQGPRSGGRCSS